jgi:hypothetical protein
MWTDRIRVRVLQTRDAAIAELDWQGRRLTGSSKRAPEDKYVADKGLNLAVLRALRKLVKQLEGVIGPDALDAPAASKPPPDAAVTGRPDPAAPRPLTHAEWHESLGEAPSVSSGQACPCGWSTSVHAPTVDAAGATDPSDETKQERVERCGRLYPFNDIPTPCVRPKGHPEWKPGVSVGCSLVWRSEDGPEPPAVTAGPTEPAVTAESPAYGRWINVQCLDRDGRSLVSLTPFLNGGAVWLPPGTAKIQLSKP